MKKNTNDFIGDLAEKVKNLIELLDANNPRKDECEELREENKELKGENKELRGKLNFVKKILEDD